MKTALFLHLFCCFTGIFSQQIEWGIGTESNASLNGFLKTDVSVKGNTLSAFITGDSENTESKWSDQLKDTKGKSLKFSVNHHGIFIANFNSEGEVNWSNQIFTFDNKSPEIICLSIDSKENSYALISTFDKIQINDGVLIFLKSSDTYFNISTNEEAFQFKQKHPEIDPEQFLDEDIDELAEDSIGMYWLVKFDKAGKIVWAKRSSKTIDENLDDEIDNMYTTKNGHFLIYGTNEFKGSIFKKDKYTEGRNGYFIAEIDSCFHFIWNKAFSLENEKGKYNAYPNPIIVCKDQQENIYVSVQYKQKMYLDNEAYKTKKIRAQRKWKYRTGGTLLVSLNPKGEVQWKINSENAVYISDMRVNKNMLVIAAKQIKTTHILDEKIDTTGQLSSLLFCFDTKGNKLFQYSEYNVEYQNLDIDDQGNIYVLTSNYLPTSKTKVRQGFTRYIYEFNKTGKLITFKNFNLPLSTQYDYERNLFVSKKNTVFLIGEIWCGLSAQLNAWDKNFKSGGGHGGVPFMLKIRIK